MDPQGMSLDMPAEPVGEGPAGSERRLLSRATLHRLPALVTRPPFDPAALQPGILHLGCGAFHRAHQALLTQHAIGAELARAPARAGARVPPWGIVAASLRTAETVRALKAQSGLYSVIERGPRRARLEVVGTLRDLVFVPGDSATVAACFAHAAIRLVTLTVSVAGYCIDPATGRLDAQHPEIRADLTGAAPRSAIGVLVAGLAQRRAHGLAPPVVLSCDNVPGNGRLLRQACLDFAALRDDRLAHWIDASVRFPSTMVDRIVPVPSDEERHDAIAALGLLDRVPVAAEPFCQWIIERFDGPRPQWELAGAEFVSDVRPWETVKLRLLNGSHLVIAYLGLLAGHPTVADAIEDTALRALALRFMLDEQRPTVQHGTLDVAAYARQLVDRWRNRGIVDPLVRVGREGSTKLPARLLAPLRQNLRDGRPAPCTLLAIAAWIRCLTLHGSHGGVPGLSDPLAGTLRRIARAAGDDAGRLVDGVLGLSQVFSRSIAAHPLVRRELAQALATLQQLGPRAAITAALGHAPA
jgi:fructuronate reductase